MLKKLRDALKKTRTGVVKKLSAVVSRHPRADEAMLEELEEVLIGADIGVETSEKIIRGLRESIRREAVSDSGGIKELLKQQVLAVWDGSMPVTMEFTKPEGRPYVIMVVGVNGTGKTTMIGKLAKRFGEQGRRVVLAAADTFRAAAIEQLAIWAERTGAELVKHQPGADPASVVFDAFCAAQARGADLLIIDTAGRFHTKVNLMEQLKKIKRVLQKRAEGTPDETILVLDATTGQNAIAQADYFNQAIGVSGIALAKLDGTAKGGVVVAIKDSLNIPIKMVGIGEGADDLKEFDSSEFVDALFAEE
ncbi:MAG: signal recognition particle-docking protein FtsY [Candidatus Latescibacteria bacterium 4484_181]|nr:MAG: signal recognition particle-docking protein FtsY [Candidatus Latescibacteria bacterium 4484_181]